MGNPFSEPGLLLENGSHFLLEDGVSDVLLQVGSPSGASVIYFAPQQCPYTFGLAMVQYASPIVLVINRTLHSVAIRTQSEPTPWSIDPERTQQIE
jgi:hypothetical protein